MPSWSFGLLTLVDSIPGRGFPWSFGVLGLFDSMSVRNAVVVLWRSDPDGFDSKSNGLHGRLAYIPHEKALEKPSSERVGFARDPAKVEGQVRFLAGTFLLSLTLKPTGSATACKAVPSGFDSRRRLLPEYRQRRIPTTRIVGQRISSKVDLARPAARCGSSFTKAIATSCSADGF